MEKITKSVVNAINSLDANNNKSLGEIITPIYFRCNHSALFLDTETQHLEILLPPDSHIQATTIFKQLTELLSILRELQTNHLIYTISTPSSSTPLFYEGMQDFKSTTLPLTYNIAPSLTLRTNATGIHTIYRDNKLILQGFRLPSPICKDLATFLNAIVYPTIGLKTYIEHKYLPTDRYEVKRANKISKISIWIAIILAAASLVSSIILGNKYSITTLNPEQYNGLKACINNHTNVIR